MKKVIVLMVAMITIVSCNKEEDCTCGEITEVYTQDSQPKVDIKNTCTDEIAVGVHKWKASLQEGDIECNLDEW